MHRRHITEEDAPPPGRPGGKAPWTAETERRDERTGLQEHRTAEQMRDDARATRLARHGGRGTGAQERPPWGAGGQGDPNRPRGPQTGLNVADEIDIGSQDTAGGYDDDTDRRTQPPAEIPVDEIPVVHDRAPGGRGRGGRGRRGGAGGGGVHPYRIQALVDEILRNRPAASMRPAQQVPVTVPVIGGQKPTLQPIIQKVTVTQKVGADKKRRKKKLKAIKTKSVTAKRKEYTALKKQVKKALVAEKKTSYTKGNDSIKKMPVKERSAARKKLKTDLKRKLDTLVQQMPAAGKKGHEELNRLLSKVRKLKWI